MCDVSNRKSFCHGSKGKWLKPLKLSKWELPLPSSKPYWDGVFSEIEKRNKKVRDNFNSFPLSKPLASSIKTQLPSKNVKFEISPPTPSRRTHQPHIRFEYDNHAGSNGFENTKYSNITNNDFLEATKSSIVSLKKPEIISQPKKLKVFSKKSCPYHGKNTVKLPTILKEDKIICGHYKVSQSESDLVSSSSLPPEDITCKTTKKAPKLGKASLLPSFAKPVSIDSSDSSKNSFEYDNDDVWKARDTKVEKKDFLQVPNLYVASLHPSFKKLLPDKSFNHDNYVTRDFSVEIPEKISSSKKKNNTEKLEAGMVNMINGEKKESFNSKKLHVHKVLDVIKKNNDKGSTKKNGKISRNVHAHELAKKSFDTDINYKKIECQDRSTFFYSQEVQKNPKLITDNCTNMSSMTIRSASRSTSGLSLDFQANDELVPSLFVLREIPTAKIFPRAYFDKCYACLYKPFEKEIRKNRKLSLAALKFAEDEPQVFNVVGSSSCSDSEELKSIFFYSSEDYSHLIDLPIISKNQDDVDEEDISDKFDSLNDPQKVVIDTNLLSPVRNEVSSPKHAISRSKEHSLSAQSSDRSRSSTPSNQSSDLDDDQALENKLPTSKYTAPCHAPVVWRPSFEPLKALKLKKATSLRERAAALVAKPSENSDSDSYEKAKEFADTQVNEDKEVIKDFKQVKEKKKKPKKPLVRIKTATENIARLVSSVDENQGRDTKVLKKAKTTFDLIKYKSDESSTDELEDEEDISTIPKNQTNEEVQEEQLPCFDVIRIHQADSPLPPIMTSEDIMRITKSCLQNSFDPNDLIEKLSSEYVKRIKDQCENVDKEEDIKSIKLGLRLFQALLNSRFYLRPSTFKSDLEFNYKYPILTNSFHPKVPPSTSHELIADILSIPRHHPDHQRTRSSFDNLVYTKNDDESIRSSGMSVHPPTPQKLVQNADKSFYRELVNPYALFLKKPRRKVVTWRPLCEKDLKGYDPEATLEMRAARLLDKICREFCEWLKQLGGDEQIIDEETLKDMFTINFTAEACKSTQVIVKEMPTVPIPVAMARHCEFSSELEATRKQILRDLEVEKLPKHTVAFGQCLPNDLRFVPPQSQFTHKWLECEHVPKDFKDMGLMWKDIMHLDSMQTFMQYLKNSSRVEDMMLSRKLTSKKQVENPRENGE